MARFSIRGLLIVVAFVAVACAALKYAGPVSWTILSAAGVLLLIASTIVAFIGKGEQRAKAIGTAVCIAIYGILVCLFYPPESNPSGPMLPTTRLTLLLAEYLANHGLGSEATKFIYEGVDFTRVIDLRARVIVGHLLWTMLFGFLGSVFAGFVYHRSHPPDSEGASA